MDALPITRQFSVRLVPDPGRVITKLFMPGDEVARDGSSRLEAVLHRIMALTDDEVTDTLADARELFAGRHRDFDAVLDRHHDIVAARFADRSPFTPPISAPISTERRRLIGAYFTHEYSIEAAALGNPSVVIAPDQSGVAAGAVRFVMSLRAIGEGHLSSIEFRTGVVDADGTVELDPVSPYAETGVRSPHAYDKGFFSTKLADLAMLNEVEERVLARLSERFTMSELESAIAALDDDGIDRSMSGETTRFLHWLASSNYRVSFPPSTEISERVLFPSGPTESHGMEDARFVRFVDDDGTVTYYATYTAYDGHQILPQLIETADFSGFRIATLTGHAAQNKGMAIFPRRIGGRYVALGRQDNVNNFVMTSTDIRVWREATLIQEPKQPWELMQLGNCGSPLETDAGWLVITHGVGPLRRYTLGALLLDIDDPSRVIGHLREPLLSPSADEREGYVPNVVYSCGSLIHGDHLVLPYGYADVGARVATMRVDELLSRLTDPST
jgi:predicted GH43/DUF377 family glycosyl hydrolase